MARVSPSPSNISQARTSEEVLRIERCQGIARNLTQKERALSSVLNEIRGVSSRIDDTGRRLIQYQYRLRDADSSSEKNNISNMISSLEDQIKDFSSRQSIFERNVDDLREEVADLKSQARRDRCNFA